VNATDWDKDNIGNQSFAAGFNTKAAAFGSFSMGSSNVSSGSVATTIGFNNIASGDASMILGTSSTASGFNSTSIGSGNFAIGNYAISIGSVNWAVGNNSMAMGTSNVTRAISSTTLGYNNVALSPNSLVIGAYNDTTLADKLFEIGNGSVGARSNALTVLRNGNTGIGNINPTNLLTFAPIGGKKISLFPGSTGDAGMGIFPNEFRQYTDNSNADFTFGYDNYGVGFSEKVRFKANGMVGIGTASPVLSTGGSGIVAQNSTYIQLRVQSSASAAGMEFKPSTGNQYEIQADNTNNWFVYNRNANAYRLFINGSGFVGIGTNNPTQALQVVGNILASGTITPSDIRYKKNIQPIQSPMDKLMQLNGVTYEYRKEEFPQMGFNDNEQVGLIAQEVEKVFPQLVVTDEKGFKAVDYVKLVPVLIEALKDNQKQLREEQKQRKEDMKRMEQMVNELKAMIQKK
jgi:FtsZ-binding cell division protein ZapB